MVLQMFKSLIIHVITMELAVLKQDNSLHTEVSEITHFISIKAVILVEVRYQDAYVTAKVAARIKARLIV